MTTKHKKQILGWLAGTSLLVSAFTAGSALAATSTITVTSTPLLSFANVPDPLSMGSISVPLADTELTSDSDGILPSSRYLVIEDTRGCGGLNLQLQADNFTPSTTPELKNELRVITSTADFIDGVVVNGVKYYSGFAGDQTITAPLNAPGINFSDPTLFTDPPFDTVDNTLDTPLDLLQGNLNAPTGRTGYMQINTVFYLLVPKLTVPNDYYTTLTFTLSDDTTGSCP